MDTISIRIKLEQAERFAADTRIAKVEIDGLGDAADRANKKSRDSAGGQNLLEKAMGFTASKAGILTIGLGLLVQALSAGTTGAVGFVAALAPLAGLLGALPAGMLLAAQGAGVMKLAFSGVSGALGGLNGELEPKKFAKLTVPAQQFVLLLNSMKKPIVDLQRRLQGALFPGLTAGLKAASPALHALTAPLTGTAKVFGSLGDRLGHLVGSRGFLADLRSQAQFNNVELNRLGGAGLHVVDALRQIMVASRPLVDWLVRLVSGWAALADKTLTADRHNGKLAHTFGVIQHTTESVFKVLGNLGKALFNIGNLGRKHLGESLLASLVKGSASLKKWTESGPGIAKITKFFENAKPVVYAFAKLIGAIVVDFLKLGSSGGTGLAAIFDKLRTEALPVVLKLTEAVTKMLGLLAKVPGGGGLIGGLFLLSKLGGGGGGGGGSLFGGLAQGLGQSFGKSFADAAKGQIGGGLKALATDDAVIGAGTSLGLVLAGAIGAAILGYGLGKVINEALPNGLFGKPTPSTQKANNAILGLGKGTRVEHGEIKPNRGFPNTHLGGKPAPHGATVHVYDRLLHKYVNVHPGETLPGPAPVHHGAAFTGPTLHAPTTAEVSRSGGGARADAAPIHVHSYTTLVLNDKPIAEGTNEVVARQRALA